MDKKKILYIEDNISNFIFVRDILKSEGYEVISAFNGLDGIKRASMENPSLIVLDINIPGLNGYEVCVKIRSYPFLKDVPIIVVSGDYDKTLVDRARALGANDILSKPLNAEVLISKINSYLKEERASEKIEIDFEELEKDKEKFIQRITNLIFENKNNQDKMQNIIDILMNKHVIINDLYRQSLTRLEDSVETIEEQRFVIKGLLKRLEEMEKEYLLNPKYINNSLCVFSLMKLMKHNFESYIKDFNFDKIKWNIDLLKKLEQDIEKEREVLNLHYFLKTYFSKQQEVARNNVNMEANFFDNDIIISANSYLFKQILNAFFYRIFLQYKDLSIKIITKPNLYKKLAILTIIINKKIDMESLILETDIKEIDFLKNLADKGGMKLKNRIINDSSTEVKVIFELEKVNL